MSRWFILAGAVGALSLSCLTTSALASVSYTFATGSGPVGPQALVELLGAAPSVSGSFQYNAQAPLLGLSGNLGGESGYAVYVGNASALAFSALQGHVAGASFSESFSDVYGLANVGNNHAAYGGADVLSLGADPVTAGFARQLQGFTAGPYTLGNVRLFWDNAGGRADFLADQSLPGQLPSFAGTLALDFYLTSDPGSQFTAPYAHTVFFAGTTVQAVPEPSTLGLSVLGLALMAARFMGRKHRASAG